MSKAPKIVEDAMAALAAAEAKVKEADAACALARIEVSHAYEALRIARIAADSNLPKCTIVTKGRLSKTQSASEGVILRKTPTGLLVVRRVGAKDDSASRFAWSEFRRAYMEKKPRGSGMYHGSFEVLADVPAEFMPQGPVCAVQ